MKILLPFYILSAAMSAVLCVCFTFTGGRLALMFVLFFIAAFAGLLLLLLVFLAVLSLFIDPARPQRKREWFYCALVSFVMGLIAALSRVRIHAEGLEKLPKGRWLLVCNHRSGYDPIVTGWVLRRYELAFISKPQNLRLPVVGRIVHKACYLSIDRENDRAALRTILESVDLIKRNVVSIGIYPEGTRNPTDELLPFRNGAFKIAQKADVPIVVAAIRDTDLVKRNFPWRHTDVYFSICSVIDAESVKQMKTDEIGEEVRKCIICAGS